MSYQIAIHERGRKMIREAVFECTYASAVQRCTAYVRAWNAREAIELFADELRADGVAERGSISVRARRDAVASTSMYPLQ